MNFEQFYYYFNLFVFCIFITNSSLSFVYILITNSYSFMLWGSSYQLTVVLLLNLFICGEFPYLIDWLFMLCVDSLDKWLNFFRKRCFFIDIYWWRFLNLISIGWWIKVPILPSEEVKEYYCRRNACWHIYHKILLERSWEDFLLDALWGPSVFVNHGAVW